MHALLLKMIPNTKACLRNLFRDQEYSKSRDGYLCLDRNERVSPYEKEFLNNFFLKLNPSLISTYPNPSILINCLADQLDLDHNYIYPANGSDGAIRMIFQTYVSANDRVIMTSPSYAMFEIYTQINNGEACLIQYDRKLKINILKLEEELCKGAKMLIIANPDQPTGNTYDKDLIIRLCSICKERGILIVIDEAYYPFFPETSISLTKEYENLIVTRSFSKWGGMAGLRLGYMVADSKILEQIKKVRGAHEVNSIAMELGVEILKNKKITENYAKAIEEGRDLLRSCANNLNLGFPNCPTNFQLIDFKDKVIASNIVDFMEKEKIYVKGKFSWPCLESCVRITLDNSKNMTRVVDIINKYYKNRLI